MKCSAIAVPAYGAMYCSGAGELAPALMTVVSVRVERGRIQSRLDSIPGVGAVKRKALLRRFGLFIEKALGLGGIEVSQDSVERFAADAVVRVLLDVAASLAVDYVFPSRTETISVLRYGIEEAPEDSRGHLYLGNLYAELGGEDSAPDGG